MTTSPSITERLQSGNIVSNEELHAQGKRIDSMPAEERNQLRNAIDTYVRENEQVLAQNIDTGNALLALRQKLATKDDAERGTLEKISMQTGQMIGSTADRMVTDAKDIGYHEWKNLRNPEQRLSSKIFSIMGEGKENRFVLREGIEILRRDRGCGTFVQLAFSKKSTDLSSSEN